jgi:electron transport complex protein RnfE
MDAWLHDLHVALGVFLPLLVANLAIQWRAERMAAGSPGSAVLAGLRTGAAMAAVLFLLGIARELVGHGSLLHSSATLLAGWTSALDRQLFDADMGFLLAMLPPGAFISFGVLLAAGQWITRRRRHE